MLVYVDVNVSYHTPVTITMQVMIQGVGLISWGQHFVQGLLLEFESMHWGIVDSVWGYWSWASYTGKWGKHLLYFHQKHGELCSGIGEKGFGSIFDNCGLEIFVVLSGYIHKSIEDVLLRCLRVAEILVACCLVQLLLVSGRGGTWLWCLSRWHVSGCWLVHW
jgi:hypothetical protein